LFWQAWAQFKPSTKELRVVCPYCKGPKLITWNNQKDAEAAFKAFPPQISSLHCICQNNDDYCDYCDFLLAEPDNPALLVDLTKICTRCHKTPAVGFFDSNGLWVRDSIEPTHCVSCAEFLMAWAGVLTGKFWYVLGEEYKYQAGADQLGCITPKED
jgi:hypothetical protein